jgi:predicted DCC family thiol-disulfide oxidoreductase YuxK
MTRSKADTKSAHLTTAMSNPTNTSNAACTVFYDGGCPVCSREIAVYQRLSEGAVDAPSYVDVTRAAPGTLAGLTKDEALERFHVMTGDGRLVSGAAAFIALWRATPRLKLLGRLASIPPLPWLLEGAYLAFLKLRPLWRN